MNNDSYSYSRQKINRRRRRRQRKIFRTLLMAELAFVVVLLGAGSYFRHWQNGDLPEVKEPVQKNSMEQEDSAPDDFVSDFMNQESGGGQKSDAEILGVLSTFVVEQNLTFDDYPQSILELLERNPEAEEFALHYPLEYGKTHEIDMSEYEALETPPLFLQWDKRWGYLDYGNDVVGISGCGPVTLAMAGYYLTGDEKFRPDRVVQFALDNDYCVSGSGSLWTLISKGGKKLGLDVIEIPLDENRMKKNLEVGNLIICIMGPGDFTTSGHFILLTGVEDGKFRVNDANSRANSEKLWSYEGIKGQIKNLWVIRK